MTNKRLEKLQPLRHRVAIYVPGTNGVNTAADNAHYVKMAAATLSNLFGGATATPAIGYWMSDAARAGRGKNHYCLCLCRRGGSRARAGCCY